VKRQELDKRIQELTIYKNALDDGYEDLDLAREQVTGIVRDILAEVIGRNSPVTCECGNWSCEDWAMTGGINAAKEGMRNKAKELLD
jgi:hypothetical protein